MLAGSIATVAVRLAAWLVLVFLGASAPAVPADSYVAAAAVGASLVATVALGCTISSIWRGPPVIAFAQDGSLLCGEEESEPVRAYAQLRGTIGGAGHVFPLRLVLPAVAWAAALVAGARAMLWPGLEVLGAVPALVATSSAIAAWLFPARAYWYREVMGGGAIVWPAEAVAELTAREHAEPAPALAVIHEVGRADPMLRAPGPGFHGAHSGHPEARHTPARSAPAFPTEPSPPAACASAFRRPPRYAHERRIIVQQDGIELEVATLDVSHGGLAVRWPAELPVVGNNVRVKIQDGPVVRELQAEVRWHAGDDERAVGLKLAGGDALDAWRDLVERAARRRTPSA